MNRPLLSVCLITYNHVQFIEQAIDSVFAQEVDFSWELIIADDFSTDGTREIILKYKEKYPDNIRLILQKQNVGSVQNWMDLITASKATYLAYFEGDDYWTLPYKLQRQIDFLENNPDFNLCFHNVDHLTLEGNLVRNTIQPQGEITTLEDLALENYITSLSIVFRNTITELPRFLFKSPLGDYTLYFLIAIDSKIQYFDEVMGVYRLHANSMFRSKPLEERYCDIMAAISLIFENLELNDTIKENLLIHFRRIRSEMLNNSFNNDQPLSTETISQLNSFDSKSLISSFYNELQSHHKTLTNSQLDADRLSRTVRITTLLEAILKKFYTR